ncbi:AbrB/MazE/SpoVT family DNA-binding domain-containing protein [Patescibacteria group bacterium]|nr:AbrB/MazE/SpoVT family DNA-binding domain-containing protein [Patescibacteria group bacterium]MBU4481824.1 AbrB/MazE/SpoVT family DNA-binding domain-containing protein [Patescibacteria group bacterium]
MSYQTTITKKGQITIPKYFRGILKLKPYSRVILELDDKKVKISPAPDILALAGKFKPQKRQSALKLRKIFEKKYERI